MNDGGDQVNKLIGIAPVSDDEEDAEAGSTEAVVFAVRRGTFSTTVRQQQHASLMTATTTTYYTASVARRLDFEGPITL